MSDLTFPEVRGLAWDCVDRPVFATIIKESASGKTTRAARRSQPIWEFDLSYEFLSDDPSWMADPTQSGTDLELVQGFFLARRGSFDSFLWRHPDKNCVSGLQIATGDGATTQFQAVRNVGGYLEPIQSVDATTLAVQVAGADATATVDSKGLITITPAPAAGAAITANFNYFFRVRFKTDSLDFSIFMQHLYELRQLTLVQELQ